MRYIDRSIIARRPGLGLVALALLLCCGTIDAASAPHTTTTPSAPAGTAACDAIYAGFAGLQPLSRSGPASIPAIEEPAKGIARRDPTFGTCVIRLTDAKELPDIDGKRPDFARNDYSRRQPFNADDTRILAYISGGYWITYDASTLQPGKVLSGPTGDAEPQWDPVDPNTLYYIDRDGGTTLYKLNVKSNRSSTQYDFAKDVHSLWRDANRCLTKAEGSPSADNRLWGLMCMTSDFAMRGFIVIDTVARKIVWHRDSTEQPDHVSMSPSGRYFVASGDPESGYPLGTVAFVLDKDEVRKLHHKSEHSDIAIGIDGHDEYVSVDFEANTGDVFYIDIDACHGVPTAAIATAPACPRTTLFANYVNGGFASMHLSGKAYRKPGWVLISTYNTRSKNGVLPWQADMEMAVELHAAPRIYGLAYHHGGDEGYWTEQQGSVNRSFTRAVFNSNWNSGSKTAVDDYLIVLPPDAIPDARATAAP